MRIKSLIGGDTSRYIYQFKVDQGGYSDDVFDYSNLSAGKHDLYIKQINKSDLSFCEYSDKELYKDVTIDEQHYDSLQVNGFYVFEPTELIVYVKPIPSGLNLSTGKIVVDSVIGGIKEYSISKGNNFFETYHTNFTYENLPPDSYQILVKDQNGCLVDTTIVIGIDFFVPTVFTPNFDGKNDYFEIFAFEQVVSIRIFDRWGTIIYKNTDYKNDWDGGTEPDGVYFYEIETSKGRYQKGWVQIVR